MKKKSGPKEIKCNHDRLNYIKGGRQQQQLADHNNLHILSHFRVHGKIENEL
jgi:hypothetical protein